MASCLIYHLLVFRGLREYIFLGLMDLGLYPHKQSSKELTCSELLCYRRNGLVICNRNGHTAGMQMWVSNM